MCIIQKEHRACKYGTKKPPIGQAVKMFLKTSFSRATTGGRQREIM